jgi:hypothetical protein
MIGAVQVYAPKATVDEKIVQDFMADKNYTLRAVSKLDFIIYMEYINTKTGSQTNNRATGCFGLG